MNVTDHQKDLLRRLVSEHQSTGGQASILFLMSDGRLYICGDSAPLANDQLDLVPLRSQNLITFNQVDRNQWRVQPTERGIKAVRNNFFLSADRSQQAAIATEQERPLTIPTDAEEEQPSNAIPALVSSEGKESGSVLNTSLIKEWMDTEGWSNETLARQLHLSERAISSLRNNGIYHGMDAITKLANLMGRDPDDLYLPEASS